MNHRSTVITTRERRLAMTPARHRELVRLYWNHRQLVKRYRAGQLTEKDRQIGFDAGHLSAVTLLLRDRLGIAHNVTYINQH